MDGRFALRSQRSVLYRTNKHTHRKPRAKMSSETEESFHNLEDEFQQMSLEDEFYTRMLQKILHNRVTDDNPITDSEFEDIMEIASDPDGKFQKVIVEFLIDLVERKPHHVPQVFDIFETALHNFGDSVVDEDEIQRFVGSAYEWVKTTRDLDQETINVVLERIEDLEKKAASLAKEFEAGLKNLDPWEAQLKRAEKMKRPTLLLSLPSDDLETAFKECPDARWKIIMNLKRKVDIASGRDYNRRYTVFMNFLRKHRFMLSAEV